MVSVLRIVWLATTLLQCGAAGVMVQMAQKMYGPSKESTRIICDAL
jgi:hypothetical protein